MKKYKVYIAGSLFNEAEVLQRKLEGKILREEFGNTIDVFNPIDQPFNENKESLPTPLDIFMNDTNAVLDSDCIIADVTNEDPGVMFELGIAYNSNKYIIGINSDIRLKSANKYDIPSYSMNHYVLGGIEKNGILVYSFKEAVDVLKDKLKTK